MLWYVISDWTPQFQWVHGYCLTEEEGIELLSEVESEYPDDHAELLCTEAHVADPDE